MKNSGSTCSSIKLRGSSIKHMVISTTLITYNQLLDCLKGYFTGNQSFPTILGLFCKFTLHSILGTSTVAISGLQYLLESWWSFGTWWHDIPKTGRCRYVGKSTNIQMHSPSNPACERYCRKSGHQLAHESSSAAIHRYSQFTGSLVWHWPKLEQWSSLWQSLKVPNSLTHTGAVYGLVNCSILQHVASGAKHGQTHCSTSPALVLFHDEAPVFAQLVMQSLTSSNRKLLISPDVASWPCRYLVVQDMTRSSCGHCTPQLCLKKQLLCRSSPSLGCSRVCQRASGGQAASRIKTNMSNLYRKLCQCEQDAPENTRQILAVAESTLSKGYSKHSWSFFVHNIHQNCHRLCRHLGTLRSLRLQLLWSTSLDSPSRSHHQPAGSTAISIQTLRAPSVQRAPGLLSRANPGKEHQHCGIVAYLC